jgi:ADP-L-glycero-D-manno-heptose 6-epimerase
MILVTGGAGFIGSFLHASLRERGHETIVVDRLRDAGKWRNLRNHPPSRVIAPDDLDAFLQAQPPVEMVFHLGAISTTTATDGDLTWATNVELSQKLWHWCAAHGVRFIYASSAATYGDGAAGSATGWTGWSG